eukprot:CAMPEP_0179883656 /NCGR_PEP_ID=MMETSP0982-20121206/28844_1 /TAXON_ID=483367 /ORGANISM="non described non described, Strain CCMP 2436" /LENGTH=252 /DNA_ID=CAMNT_0021778145 /DNA_START=74 /DNA_END=832 /DNA_ORIENTATION=+
MASARPLLHEPYVPYSQIEPYFPLPARFGPWLTWGATLLGVGSVTGGALGVYTTQPPPQRLRLGITQLPAYGPARTALGVGLCALAFLYFVTSWCVFHSLELRLQGIASRNSLANRLAYRLGALAALGLFASGSAVHALGDAPSTHLAMLSTTGAITMLQFCIVTSLVHRNQPRLMRSVRDFLWLRVKMALLLIVDALVLARLVLPLVWAGTPLLLTGALENCAFFGCCIFIGTFSSELRHFSLQLQPVIVL